VGGGVTAETAMPLIDAGASHVIVTSYVFRDGIVDQTRLDAIVKAVGKERLVLDLSCRKKGDDYYVVTDRWQRWTDLKVDAATMASLASQCDEFLVHGVDVEGMKLGIDDELVARLGKHSPIPVTYAGGARSIADLELVRGAGEAKVDITVGSALDCFGGALPYDEVVAWHNKQKELVRA
jgi:phosphoribosylformimino-5-aminoimidazole carboxamide ribotide isomerase